MKKNDENKQNGLVFLDKCEKNASFSQCHHYFICDKNNINFNDDE